MTTLFRNGHVLSPAAPVATALLVDDEGAVSWLGADADAPRAGEVVDLDGRLVTPAFVDAHAHVAATGVLMTELSLLGTRSAVEVLDRVAAFVRGLPREAVVTGQGYDESTWEERRVPSREELDSALGGRRGYLSRVCGHEGLASSALRAEVGEIAGLEGYSADGPLTLYAHRRARAVAAESMSVAQRAGWQRAALRRAAGLGVASIHECGMPSEGTSVGEADFSSLLKVSAEGGLPRVVGYWGELCAAEKARDLGAHACGGDLSADGSIGARTAALREDYADAATRGHAYLSAEDVENHILDCHRHGLQGGFHAIGDQAIANVVTGVAAAAQQLGVEAVRGMRHRVEHAELLDKQLIAGFVAFGLHASVQPAFDAAWGGTDKMYAARLGRQRALGANPFASLAGVGVPLAFGSDSPVTPTDPWGGIAAAVWHHNPAQRLSLKAAFAAATRGGWRAMGDDVAGVLAPGAPATFAVWDHRSAELPDPVSAPVCHRTVLSGRTIHVEE
ncbi:amidohydrolase [Phytomonospora endophytica]|uniref:Amidohydrolase 3 domain-containing protein n=1 Tax=Phytomonospora endophytica TaxID=714109 RepID=A0A841FFE5_9ACTN|nr:amidohydrolase family protein [Phytomonospora endophytica]MBB6033723.1 hypothetical protein [Phytomonospora endophytica]GIG64759.1 amidohydrolase [Phytomonospora endophytica]